MVCNLTLGKKKYAGVQQDIQQLIGQTEALRSKLQQLVQADADAFEPLSKAYGLPKDAPERDQTMAQCLKEAGAVPLRIMETCAQVVGLLEELAEKGSRLALSDVGVAAVFCRAALEGASLNVYINTKSMANREYAEELNQPRRTVCWLNGSLARIKRPRSFKPLSANRIYFLSTKEGGLANG